MRLEYKYHRGLNAFEMAEDFQHMLSFWTFYLHIASVEAAFSPVGRGMAEFSEGWGIYIKFEVSHWETWVPAT